MKKINILYAETGLGFGGAVTCLAALLKGLDKEKYNPIVISSHDDMETKNLIKNTGASFVYIKKYKRNHFVNNLIDKTANFGLICKGIILSIILLIEKLLQIPFFLKIMFLAKKYKVDIVHFNTGINNNVEAIAASRILKIPSICHVRGPAYNSFEARFIAKFITCFVSISKFVENSLLKLKVPHNKLNTIYDGIDLSEYGANSDAMEIDKLNDYKFGKYNIGLFGCLLPWKGHKVLIEAVDILVKNKGLKEAKFFIIGNVPDKNTKFRDDLIDLVTRLELSNYIVFTGYQKNVYQFMSKMDIVVHTSISPEPFGMVIIEAMAAGKPVITTAIKGINEVANINNSLLVPPKDAQLLAKAIERLVLNEKERILLGIEAKKSVQEKFSLEAMCGSYNELYLGLISKKICQRKNILFYECSSGFGGSANSLANIINHLDKKRFYPIVALKNYGAKIDKIKNTEIIKLQENKEPKKLSSLQFIFFFLKYIIPEMIKICFIIKRKKISLVHINTNIILGIPAIIASKIAGIPCTCHIRETRKPIKREVFFARWIDRLIVLNNETRDIYRRHISESKISLIYDGIVVDEFKKTEIGRFKRDLKLEKGPLIGVIARIVEGKGQQEFVLAAKEVLKSKPDAKFIIVGDAKGGDTAYFNQLKELVKKERLDNSVIFTGYRNDVKDIISDLDILVHPATSFPEGLPNILIEAMALGKPVIATDIPGSREIVRNNKTGILVSPGNIKELATKIIYLLDNPQTSRQISKEGKKRCEELFDVKKCVKDIEKIYEEVLA